MPVWGQGASFISSEQSVTRKVGRVLAATRGNTFNDLLQKCTWDLRSLEEVQHLPHPVGLMSHRTMLGWRRVK